MHRGLKQDGSPDLGCGLAMPSLPGTSRQMLQDMLPERPTCLLRNTVLAKAPGIRAPNTNQGAAAVRGQSLRSDCRRFGKRHPESGITHNRFKNSLGFLVRNLTKFKLYN